MKEQKQQQQQQQEPPFKSRQLLIAEDRGSRSNNERGMDLDYPRFLIIMSWICNSIRLG